MNYNLQQGGVGAVGGKTGRVVLQTTVGLGVGFHLIMLMNTLDDDNEDVDDKVVNQTVVGRFTPAKISRAQRCKSV